MTHLNKLIDSAAENPNVLFKIHKVFDVFEKKFIDDDEIITVCHSLWKYQAKHLFNSLIKHKQVYREDRYMKLSQFLMTSHTISNNEIIDYIYKKYTNNISKVMTHEEFDSLKTKLNEL